jgi:hypothetical protein
MDGLSQNSSFLTVSGSIMASGDVRLQSVGVTSPPANPLTLKQVAVGIGCALMWSNWPKSCCARPKDGAHRDWFSYDCPRLHFKDFQLDSNSETQPKVRVRLTKGGAQDLMRSLVAEAAVPAL